MRKIFFLLMILVICMGFVSGYAFKATTPPKDFYRYFNEDEAYSINFPKGWKVRNDKKTSTVTATAPQYIFSRYREVFMIHVFDLSKGHPPIEKLVQYTIEQFEAIGDKIYEQGESVIDNAKAIWYIQSIKEKPDLKHLVYSFIKDKRTYELRSVTTSEKFPKFRATFEEWAHSFRFE